MFSGDCESEGTQQSPPQIRVRSDHFSKYREWGVTDTSVYSSSTLCNPPVRILIQGGMLVQDYSLFNYVLCDRMRNNEGFKNRPTLCFAPLFVAYCLYFANMKVGLWDHCAVCVYTPNISTLYPDDHVKSRRCFCYTHVAWIDKSKSILLQSSGL
jgi:hypothetical protein